MDKSLQLTHQKDLRKNKGFCLQGLGNPIKKYHQYNHIEKPQMTRQITQQEQEWVWEWVIPASIVIIKMLCLIHNKYSHRFDKIVVVLWLDQRNMTIIENKWKWN